MVHAHATKAGFLCRLLPPSTMPPVLYSPHAFCFDGMRCGPRRRLRILFERAFASRTAAFECVSHAERSVGMSELSVPGDRITVAENGVPSDLARSLLSRAAAREILGLDQEEVLVGVPGRLAPQKGQDWMLKALAEMPASERRFRVIFCGDGPERERLEQEARGLGLSQLTTWHGYVPGLSRLLRAFDLVVMPSRYEGLSYLLLEALVAGTPMITTDIPANVPREELRRWVRYVPVEDSHALRRCLQEALSDLPTARLRAAEATAFAAAEFTLGKQVATLAGIYRHHAERGTRGGR